MRSLVLCYSRTGTTKEVAAALAERLGAELAELHCDRYRPGPLGYVRAAYDSLRRRLAPVSVAVVGAATERDASSDRPTYSIRRHVISSAVRCKCTRCGSQTGRGRYRLPALCRRRGDHPGRVGT
jgi:hypothetical protein